MDNGNQLDLSIVFPVCDEVGNIERLYDHVCTALLEVGVQFEMVFVDDGSTDGSLEVIKKLVELDERVRYISLSRNFGHQAALFAGLSHSRGAAVVTMDADMQHPPSLLPEMIQLWREGNEVVYTTKINYGHPPLVALQARLAYLVLTKLSGLKLAFGQSDYRLLDRKVVDVILSIPENRKFLRGTVDWLGFRQTGISYEVPARHSGQSKFTYRYLSSLTLDGIFAFSVMPLRWMLGIGAAIAGASLLYALIAFTMGVLNLVGTGVSTPPGWATLTVAISFFGGAQLFAIGVLGEYLGRVFEQSKGRPVFVVRESSDDSVSRKLSKSKEQSSF